MQEDIVNAVIKGNDVLALLPTGGGKSLVADGESEISSMWA